MTRDEAIEILNRDDDEMRKGYFCINDFLAIETLKQENTGHWIKSEDCVSRQALINAFPISDTYTLDDIIATIKFQPPVTPEQKTGHWIVDDFTGLIKCDICGNDAYMDTTSGEQCKSKYCPNCGAKMESEGE